MFTVKKIKINMGSELLAVICQEDAIKLNLHSKDRIEIFSKKNKKSVICVLLVADEKCLELKIKKGEIGIFNKAYDRLFLKEDSLVSISPARKPAGLEFVRSKFAGKRLSKEEFKIIISDIVDNRFSDIETTYFVLACSMNALNDNEVVYLTEAMVEVGKTLDFGDGNIVDKHCIGGIPANRTSMLIVPIIACAGLVIPKTSSRAITSPAGTADTMEVLCDVELPLDRMIKLVKKQNGCIVWGGALDLSPADDLIINVEHPLEVDCEGQMIASILSKKKSVGSKVVLIDIPVGKTAKVKTQEHALKLSARFSKIGKALGMKIKTIITDGTQPIGTGIGPLYEAYDVLKVLKCDKDCCLDLKEKALMMSGIILEMADKAKKGHGYEMAEEILTSLKALKKFDQIIESQGRKEIMDYGKHSFEVKSNKKGKIIQIDNHKVSKLAFILGCPKDKAAGMILNKKVSSLVDKDELLYTIYSSSALKLEYAKNYIAENNIYILK